MKVRRPDFYKDFLCVAGFCSDTCCAGWEIEIDEETAENYRSVPGKFGERIRSEMGSDGEESYFRLGSDRRCPFLNKNNLCDIIQNLGEEWLCDICREHPRFYQWFGDYTEAGLGLCCEEACRLMLSREESIRFELLETGENGGGEEAEEDYLLQPMLKARETAFAIVQSREDPVEKRILGLLAYAEELDGPVRTENAEEIEKLAERDPRSWTAGVKAGQSGGRRSGEEEVQKTADVKKLLEEYEGLESLDGTWGGRMRRLRKKLPELLPARRKFLEEYREREYEYEHLAVYFLYRYFMEALFDGCVMPPVRFAAASLLVIQLMDTEIWLERGDYRKEDRICTAKLYSKEIEYCPENMERLREFFG